MSDDLVDRVARAMWMACDWAPMLKPYEEVREADKRVIRMEARAAIAVVLEEAGEVSRPPAHMLGSSDSYANGYRAACEDIAAAIRAMKEG